MLVTLISWPKNFKTDGLVHPPQVATPIHFSRVVYLTESAGNFWAILVSDKTFGWKSCDSTYRVPYVTTGIRVRQKTEGILVGKLGWTFYSTVAVFHKARNGNFWLFNPALLLQYPAIRRTAKYWVPWETTTSMPFLAAQFWSIFSILNTRELVLQQTIHQRGSLGFICFLVEQTNVDFLSSLICFSGLLRKILLQHEENIGDF